MFFRNVNHAFSALVPQFMEAHRCITQWGSSVQFNSFKLSPSRYGDVIYINEPVVITYGRPLERVLYHAYRDCNPFFHHMEAMWMLAGRNDVEFISRWTSQMAKFSDDGKTFYGAYGHRWRHGACDQIEAVIRCLRMDPHSRRAVITMYHPADLWKIDLDGQNGQPHLSKDIPCNTTIMFQIEDPVITRSEGQQATLAGGKLNMTVTNRSNDLVLGALGANVVHMSILQEYVALALGVQVGVYHQVTNNLHMYVNNVNQDWLQPRTHDDVYTGLPLWLIGTAEDKSNFDKGLEQLDHMTGSMGGYYHRYVTYPMFKAWSLYKESKDIPAAILAAERIQAQDWRVACTEWLERRLDRQRQRDEQRLQNAINPNGNSTL